MVAPQYLVCGRQRKIFLLKHKHFAKADFKNTFSVSGQRCGQAKFITVTRFGRGETKPISKSGKLSSG